MKKVFLLHLFIFIFSSISAQETTLIGTAPEKIDLGARFTIKYTFNDKVDNAPSLAPLDWLEIQLGPTISQSQLRKVINGKTQDENNVTYSWTVIATKAGKFTIPPITLTSPKGNYTSNALSIEVLDKGNVVNKGANNKTTNIFLKARLSKSSIYENEGVLYTTTLYLAQQLSGLESSKSPDLKGFMIEDIDLSPNRVMRIEKLDGVNYYAVDLQKINLFPLHSGDILIEPAVADLKIMVETGKTRQTFFGLQEITEEKEVSIKSSVISLNVKPLPTDSSKLFKGAVGSYKLTTSIDSTAITLGDSVRIRVHVSGKGNIRLVEIPEIVASDKFIVKRNKVEVTSKSQVNGVSGSKTVEYIIIPTTSGDLTINVPSLIYFDPTSNAYKTTDKASIKLSVERDSLNTGNDQIEIQDENRIEEIENDTKIINNENVLFYAAISMLALLIILYVYKLLAKDKNPKSQLEEEEVKRKRSFMWHLSFVATILVLTLIIVVYFTPFTENNKNKRGDEQDEQQTEETAEEKPSDIIFAVDVSQSMTIEDLKPNRAKATNKFVSEISREIGNNNRLGLVIFGAEGLVLSPLTTDTIAFQKAINEIDSCKINPSGTAIGTAIALSVNMFDQNSNNTKHIVLITDGSNNSGLISPHTAGEIAQLYGATLHIIGISDNKPAKVPIITAKGIDYQTVKPDIDNNLLTQIAQSTGGNYYRVLNNKSLDETYKKVLSDLAKKQNGASSQTQKNSLTKEKAKQVLEAIETK